VHRAGVPSLYPFVFEFFRDNSSSKTVQTSARLILVVHVLLGHLLTVHSGQHGEISDCRAVTLELAVTVFTDLLDY